MGQTRYIVDTGCRWSCTSRSAPGGAIARRRPCTHFGYLDVPGEQDRSETGGDGVLPPYPTPGRLGRVRQAAGAVAGGRARRPFVLPARHVQEVGRAGADAGVVRALGRG